MRIISWPSSDGRHYEAEASDVDWEAVVRLFGPHPSSAELDRFQAAVCFAACWSTPLPIANEPRVTRPN